MDKSVSSKKLAFMCKFLKTVLVYYIGYLPVGYMYSVTSVTLPLLREYAGIDENQGGYLFGLRGIGLVLATFFSGMFFEWYSASDKVGIRGLFQISHHKILGFSLIFTAVTIACIPFVSNFSFLVALHFHMGFFVGFLEIGFIVQISYAWGQSAEYFLFGLDAVIGFGSILFPAMMFFVYRLTDSKDLQLRIPYLFCAFLSLFSSLGIILTKSFPKRTTDRKLDDQRDDKDSSRSSSSSSLSTTEISSVSSIDESESSNQVSLTSYPCSESDEMTTSKDNSRRINIISHIFTLENSILFLAMLIGVIIVGTINSYIALLFTYLKSNKIDTDSNLSLMFSILCIVYCLSRLSSTLVIRYVRVWILLFVDLFAVVCLIGLFLAFPKSRFWAWLTSILFAVFAGPVSTSLLIVCQSTYGLALTPGRASFIFGGQFLGETTQCYLMAYFSSEEMFGSKGVLIVGFVSALVSFFLYIIMMMLGWIYIKKKESVERV